jgi:hypothetical protein
VNSISVAADSVSPGNVIGYLVKADGVLNTIPVDYFCNSVTWRSGGTAEIPEDPEVPGGSRSTVDDPPQSPIGRDRSIAFALP